MTTKHATFGLAACLAALVALSAAADEAQDEYAVAAGHYAQGRWELAAEAFLGFLDRFPKHAREADAHFFLAESLVQAGELKRARDRYGRLLRDFPDSRHVRQALFRLGEIAYLEGDRPAAKRDLRAFRAKYPRDALNAYVLPALAETELEEGDAAAAEALYRDALADWPDGPRQDECRVGLARALEKKEGKIEEAERLLSAVADKRGSPAAESAAYYLGALKYAAGDYRAAEERFAELAHFAHNDHWRDAGRLGHAKALVQLRKFEKAEQLLAALIDHPQHGAEAAYWCGLSAKARGDFAAAQRVLSEAAAKHQRDELAEAILFHAADSARRAGNHAESNALLERLLARPAGPWHDDALLCKLRVALVQGKHVDVDALATRIEKDFSGTAVHKHAKRAWARSLTERNLHTQARLVLEPLTERADRGDPLARADLYLLAVACVGENRPTEALRAADAVLAEATGTLRADAQVVRASALILLGRYDEAIVPLRDYLAESPDGPRAATCRSELCYCLARTRELDEARRVHDDLLRRHGSTPQTGTATLRLADEVYQQGDYDWARQLYHSLENADDDDLSARALSGLGWSRLQQSDLEQAAAAFARLLARYPATSLVGEAALARGHCLQELEQPDAALAMFDLAIQRGGPREQPQALFAAARLNARLGRHEQAERLCRQFHERFPDDPDRDAVLYQWGWALIDLQRKADGLARFEEIHDRHPRSRFWPDATYRLAEAALESGDWPACRRLADEVAARCPESELAPHAKFLLGRAAAAQDDWEQAAAHMELLAGGQIDPALALRARYWIAEADYRRQRFDEAALKFASLRRQLPSPLEPWTAVVPLREAQSLAQLGRWDEALAAAQPIGRDYPLFPQQHEADYSVGRSLAGLGRFREAREAYERVLRSPQGGKTETAAMAQWMIGESYFHQRDYEAALRAYLRVESLFAYRQWQAAALLQAGKCYEQLKRPIQAKGLYERIVKEYSDTPYGPQAEERLRATRAPIRTARKR
jgi:TolA-binding protein